MKAWRRFWRRLAASLTGRRDDDRLREELETHLAMQAADNERAGLSPAAARRQARVSFGSIESMKAAYRIERTLPLLDDLARDVRQTFRFLGKAPLFTLTATASLAMGIGVNAAVFTVTERTLLRELPVPRPHELVYVVDERISTQASPRFSYPFYTAVRDNTILLGVAARFSMGLTARVNGQPVRASGELVSGNYFSVIGASAQQGRPLSVADDTTPGAHAVMVISDAFWRRAFASDASVIGRTLPLNGHPFTIVGVASPDFVGTDIGNPVDVWIPMMMQREAGRDLLTEARTNWLEMIGRLRPGLSVAQASGALTRDLEHRADLPPGVTARRLLLAPGARGNSPVRSELGPALAILMMLALLALGLACVNIASLVSVRAAGREKEVAVRLALGAGRARLVRHWLTEGLILALLGGTVGLVLAPWAARLLVASQPRALGIDVGLDWRVFLFALVASVLAGLVVAQAPILTTRMVALTGTLARASTARPIVQPRLPSHDLIVTLQIALALAMLISAALLVQSLRSFDSVNPGFRAGNLLLASLDPGAAGYDADRLDGFWRQTIARVSQVPGVESVSLARTVPLAPGRQRQFWVHPASNEKLELDTNVVGPDYFRTLETPLVAGRDFGTQDGKTSRPVVIVNERFAHLFWPNQDPVGKGIRLPEAWNPTAEVIGVVRDVKYRDLRAESGPMIYRPILQTRSTDALSLHVRTAPDPMSLLPAIRSEVQHVDRNMPLFQVTTLEAHLDGSFAQTRQAAVLTGVFGIMALILSAIGVYGVTALAVSRRTRDIGIRLALGARRGDIVRAMGRRGAAIVLAGIVLGVVGSFGVTQISGTLLFGVSAADAGTFAAMAALLTLVSVIAFAVPLRAAARLDVIAAIRRE